LLEGDASLLPGGYYSLVVPQLLRQERRTIAPLRRAELDRFGAACRTRPELRGMVQAMFDQLLPRGKSESGDEQRLAQLLHEYGFDRIHHEEIREHLKNSRIGLAQNRLPPNADIQDVRAEDIVNLSGDNKPSD